MTPEEVRTLITGGENVHVELKPSGARHAELATRMAGLSNTRGGWVIMGVDDATRDIVGVRSVKYATDNLIQAARNCTPPIIFDPPEPEVVTVDSHRLVVA